MLTVINENGYKFDFLAIIGANDKIKAKKNQPLQCTDVHVTVESVAYRPCNYI